MRSELPHNRLPEFFPADPEPRQPSTADKLLNAVWGCSIELLRFEGDESGSELSCNIELKSSIDGDDAGAVLADLLAVLRKPKLEGGVA